MPPGFLWSFFAAQAKSDPGRLLLPVLVIAAGIGLGVAVTTINGSALAELDRASRQMAGQADLSLQSSGAGMPEAAWVALARHNAVAAASPVVDGEVRVSIETQRQAREVRVRLLGVDPLRAAEVTPALVSVEEGTPLWLPVAPDRIWFNDAAMRAIGQDVGASIVLRTASGPQRAIIAGRLAQMDAAGPTAVVDIAAAQPWLSRALEVDRVDIRLADGAHAADLPLPAAIGAPASAWVQPDDNSTRAARMSRSYRANLTALSFMSLAVAAFLVLSTQSLLVARRSRDLALLGALGVRRAQRLGLVLSFGAALGALGGMLGAVLGLVAAAGVLRHIGSDLGAGFFSGSAPLQLSWLTLLLAVVLGALTGAAGSWLPAKIQASAPLAHVLRQREWVDERRPVAAWVLPGAVLVALFALTWRPTYGGIPIGGYLAIAALLVVAIASLPAALRCAVLLGERWGEGLPAASLAASAIRAQSGAWVASLAGIVVCVTLTASMMVMIHSFRTSLEHWLDHVLAAPVYVHFKEGSQQIPESAARKGLAAHPEVDRVEWMRTVRVSLQPTFPSVAVIARDLGAATATALSLAQPEAALLHDESLPEAWIAESLGDLYGYRVGDVVALPLGATMHSFRVTGTYRDYARQFGSITIDRATYEALSGDTKVADAAVHLRATTNPLAFASALAHDPDLAEVGVTLRDEIRERSLQLFDRTFAVTQFLQWVTVAIAMVGVASGYAAHALARRRELAVLLHLGMPRRALQAMMQAEGAIAALVSVILGGLTALAVAWILVHVVNRQSFYWGMDLALPYLDLAGLAVGTLLLAILAAGWAGRNVMQDNLIQAARRDE